MERMESDMRDDLVRAIELERLEQGRSREGHPLDVGVNSTSQESKPDAVDGPEGEKTGD